jgi:hypothetical protein
MKFLNTENGFYFHTSLFFLWYKLENILKRGVKKVNNGEQIIDRT